MRELKRSIAKANMRAMGIKRLFKHGRAKDGKRTQSVFARNWRAFVFDRFAKSDRPRRVRGTKLMKGGASA